MNHARFSYHHLREAIQSYADNDYEGVLYHIDELEEDVTIRTTKYFLRKQKPQFLNLMRSLANLR